MPSKESVSRQSGARAEAEPAREPIVSYAPPNDAALKAEADIARLRETLETGVFGERERGKLTAELIAAENALGRALNPNLFR